MSAVGGPEEVDLRQALPLGSEAILEWNSAFRTRCTVAEHLGGVPPRVKVEPLDDGVVPEVGTVLIVRSPGDEELRWHGRVLELGETAAVLEVTPDLGNSRSYFRMPVRMTLRLYLPEDRASELPARQTIARINELSGGGCRFLTAPDSVEMDAIYPARLPLEEDRTPLEVRIRIVRVLTGAESDEAAGVFLDLREPDRQRILRRLFEEYRRLRREVAVGGRFGPTERSGQGSPEGPGPQPEAGVVTPIPGAPKGSPSNRP